MKTLALSTLAACAALAFPQGFPSSSSDGPKPFPSGGNAYEDPELVAKNLARLLERLTPKEKKEGGTLLTEFSVSERRLLARWTDMHKSHAEPPQAEGPWKVTPPKGKDAEREHLVYFLTKEDQATLDGLLKRLKKPQRELLAKALKLYCTPKEAGR